MGKVNFYPLALLSGRSDSGFRRLLCLQADIGLSGQFLYKAGFEIGVYAKRQEFVFLYLIFWQLP